MKLKKSGVQIFALFLLSTATFMTSAAEVAANFKEHCSSCHGVDRLGGLGPALLPENLARLRKPEAEKVIRDGRPATQRSRRRASSVTHRAACRTSRNSVPTR